MAMVSISINGRDVEVAEGTSVAAAVWVHVGAGFRRSVNGEMRGALCGMGVCFECRVRIDGAGPVRSCQVLCEEGMEVVTDE